MSFQTAAGRGRCHFGAPGPRETDRDSAGGDCLPEEDPRRGPSPRSKHCGSFRGKVKYTSYLKAGRSPAGDPGAAEPDAGDTGPDPDGHVQARPDGCAARHQGAVRGHCRQEHH